jgi:hypothetical protein
MSEYAMRILLGSPSPDFMYMSASPPDAPPLSDTTDRLLHEVVLLDAACIMRAIWSDAPPAPAATTISTGFVGSHARRGGERRQHCKRACRSHKPVHSGSSC